MEDGQLLVPRLEVVRKSLDGDEDGLHEALVLIGVLLLELA